MLSIYCTIRSNGINDAVVLDLNDTDCYVQAAAISHVVPGLLAIKRKKQYISAQELCPPNIAKIIAQFHALTVTMFFMVMESDQFTIKSRRIDSFRQCFMK